METRRRLFRQPKSCPHFSIRFENVSEGSEESSRRYYGQRMRPETINIENMLETRVKNFVGNEFLYLNYAAAMDSKFFSPYGFKEVPYSGIDRQKYFTISRKGVAMWSKQECTFTPLDIWTEEYRIYSLVSKVSQSVLY